jgi:hypothetical protein
VLAAGALGACSSTPGNRRVVSDVIESLQLPSAEEACMMERLEGYTDDQLAQIADDNENWDPAGQGDTPADATEGMRLFIADYEQCTTEGGAAGGSTGTSEPSGSTDATESDTVDSTTPPTESTPAESTTATASTTPAETTEG